LTIKAILDCTFVSVSVKFGRAAQIPPNLFIGRFFPLPEKPIFSKIQARNPFHLDSPVHFHILFRKVLSEAILERSSGNIFDE